MPPSFPRVFWERVDCFPVEAVPKFLLEAANPLSVL